MTQQQVAELVGLTYAQLHKYEKGINRIAAGRLFMLAQALGVDPGYFFEGLGDNVARLPVPPQQQAFLRLARNVADLPPHYQRAVATVARCLAEEEVGEVETEARRP